jgi:signal transduction histidine kinase
MNQPDLSFELYAADRLAESSVELASAWVSLVARNGGDGRDVFDLQHASRAAVEVLREFATFVRDEDGAAFRASPAVAEAVDVLLRARRDEPGSPAAFLPELELLGEVLDDACVTWIRSYPDGPPKADAVVRVAGRLNRAPIMLTELALARSNGTGADGNGDMLVQVQQFADMLSHELNTPLNAASVTAQLLEYTDDALRSPEARRLVTLIRRNLARADAIMRDVRTAALSNGDREPVIRPFGQVLGEVIAEVHDELVAEGVRLEVDEPIPDLAVDAARTKLVLVNLVRNAIRYSDPHRPIRWVRITCSRNTAPDRCWVHVSDNGLGIPAEHHDNIFRRYFRAHPDRTNGTGLGLMIVQEAITQIGGEIEFDSVPGVGTTFRFSLSSAPVPAGKS